MERCSAKWALIALILGAGTARAGVQMPAVFSDHMVLQGGTKVPVWGTAEPGEAVSVAFDGQSKSAVADGQGRWRATLDDLRPGGPRELIVKGAGGPEVAIRDVLVGDVWVCSGQSNMTLSVREAYHPEEEIAKADDPGLRYFNVAQNPSLKVQDDVKGAWVACSPKVVGGFSAVGYFFGRALRRELGVPIGLIHSSYGGSPAEAWTSREGLDRDPALRAEADRSIRSMESLDQDVKTFASAKDAWEQANGVADPAENAGFADGWAAPDCDPGSWKPVTLPATWKAMGAPSGGVFWLRKDVELPPDAAGKPFTLGLNWISEQYDTAYVNGVEVGRTGHEPPKFYLPQRHYRVPGRLVRAGRNTIAVRIVSATEDAQMFVLNKYLDLPVKDFHSVDNIWLFRVERLFRPLSREALRARPKMNDALLQYTATALYNGMIAPLVPFAITGVIWYQGESNVPRARQYRTLFPILIADWRRHWGQGDFAFDFVQLANLDLPPKAPGESRWAELRESQARTLSMPNTGMAVAVDIGDAETIHPRNKQEVGRRLALVALARTYGRPVADSGPVYRSFAVEAGRIRLQFDHAEGGLVAKGGGPLRRFAIAGSDGKFVWAEARIDGDSVVVSSPEVARPVAVRYAWADNPEGCNLTNGSGLPAVPFRTDADEAAPVAK